MFVQVIQGKVSDPDAMRAHTEKWGAEIGPGATGWLDSTAGVTDDGTGIAVVRFESEDAARRNSERPEQGEWWQTMATFYSEEPSFHDSSWVDVDEYGDLGAAGFVQVMQGKVRDVERARDLMASDTTDWPSVRPEILGTVWAGSEDGVWTMAIYFTTEEAARAGEQQAMPPETEALMQELNSLADGETRFLDLRDPWLMGFSRT